MQSADGSGGPARFLIKLAITSKAAVIAMGSLTQQLPWAQHAPVAALQWAAAAASTFASCGMVRPQLRPSCWLPLFPDAWHFAHPALLPRPPAQMCAGSGEHASAAIAAVMNGLNHLARPAFWTTGAPLATLHLPSDQRAQCWLVCAYVAAVGGVLLPSAALYAAELAARRRFAAARGARLVLGAAATGDLPAMSSAGVAVVAALALAAVWLVLAGAAHLLPVAPRATGAVFLLSF
jgi:hypothetical protein